MNKLMLLQPAGDLGCQQLMVEHNTPDMKVESGFAKDASAFFDWYNDRLQIIVNDGVFDENAVFVRFHSNGAIAEIMVRDDLLPLVRPESGPASPWSVERDNHVLPHPSQAKLADLVATLERIVKCPEAEIVHEMAKSAIARATRTSGSQT